MIEIFDDWPNSYTHTALGIIAGLITPLIPIATIAITIAFVSHQLWQYRVEKEDMEHTLGDIVEFLIGIPIGLAGGLLLRITV